VSQLTVAGRAAARQAPLSVGLQRALRAAAERAADTVGAQAADTAELSRLAEYIIDHARQAPGADARSFDTGVVSVFRSALLAELAAAGLKRISGSELLTALVALEDLARSAEGGAPRAAGTDADADSEALNAMLEIAHDMRSPLAAILLLVEPIRRGQKGPVTPVQERQLGLIYGAALSLSALANDVIEAARGRTGAAYNPRPFSVGATMQDACDIVRPIAEEKKLDLTITFPQHDGRMGDSAAIHRVLLNLATNALKYTEQGSVTIGCTEVGERELKFWVSDTGEGLPAEALEVLAEGFRPAGRISGGRRRFSSTGLGLTICRTLLEVMGSTLEVESTPGVGTTFSFVLDLPRTPHE
jgi:signal transduction histidine kinase